MKVITDSHDDPEVTITLPQRVWQAVEDYLCATNNPTDSEELDTAVAAIKGYDSLEDYYQALRAED